MSDRRDTRLHVKILRGLASVFDPRVLLHPFRLLHYYNYTHVTQVRRLALGQGVRIAPNVSFANAERVSIGDRTQIGARCSLWAGDSTGRIQIGTDTTFGPDCFLTASDYGLRAGAKLTDQPKREQDIVVGNGVWLGARTIVTAGVTIGDGCVVGAGSVVTRNLPADAIAVGVPARVIRVRVEGNEPG